MASKSPHKGGAPPKYLNDFSKALASEVRILLQEVGKLRDERRQLQQEIAELMAVKAKHSGGGIYADFLKPEPPPAPVPVVAEAPPDPGPPIEARPGWRTVHKKAERKPKAAKSLPPPAPAPAPPPPPPEPAAKVPNWMTWHPNPMFEPTPSRYVAPLPVPPVPPTPRPPGLFGAEDP